MSAGGLSAELERALGLCRAGEFREAEQAYRDLVSAHAGAPDAWNMLAFVLCQQGRFDDAADAAARATDLRAGIAPYWLVRGNIAMARDDQRGAQASFRRALEIDPAFAEAHYRLGLSLHRDYRCAEAAASYRAALRSAPDVAEIHWQLAEALLADGLMTEAMGAYQEAFVRDPRGELDRRGCFDVLGRLHFDALPAFWHAEIERFFERENVDNKPYAGAGLRALKTKPAFREALRRARAANAAITLDAPLHEALTDRLFCALLRGCLVADAEFERFLTALRSRLLLDETARARVPADFLCALALQNFNNEFVHAREDAEAEAVASLRHVVETQLASREPLTDAALRSLLVLACYVRLDEVDGVDRLLAAERLPRRVQALLKRAVQDVRTERALRPVIESIGGSTDAVSRAVRSMYEEHPYPRWFAVDRETPFALSDWVRRELPASAPLEAPSSVRVLVAGCGTGRDAIWIASNIAGSHVLGVDLSLSSLAHGRRMAAELGLGNIELKQGDILALAGIGERFDMIASTGVLHHLRDPMSGLRSIRSLLRPGGLMKLGFYSRRARVSVTAAREIIAAQRLPSTERAIREFRQRVFAAPRDSPLKELEHSSDFYSMSTCRDLLFHVQEHQYTLPELGEMLGALDLEFLGLAELPHDAPTRYRRMFADDPRMVDIASWDAYEQQHPDTFSHMFLFWCRSRPD